MNSFDAIPTATNSHPIASTTTTTASTTSQQLFDLQFAPEVSATDNQQFHYLLQQQQQRSPPQVMYDHRRDSLSSALGTPSRRGQSKAEKRAEHNAIERARREGLNTRFQQLAHVLPNLHHDTRPSKGTIIERTLDFVKDAIQKEERYRHEIKDLRHTNRQLLKQLTHLTTGKAANNMDSDDDQVSIRSPSPAALGHTSPPGSSPSSVSSGSSHQEPTQHSKPRIRTKQKTQYLPLDSQLVNMDIPNLHIQQNTSTTDAAQRPSSLQNTASFSSESWHPPTPNAFWPQQAPSSSTVVPFNLSAISTSSSVPPGLSAPYLFNDTTQTPSSSSMYPPLPSTNQYIHAAGQGDIDMKQCDYNLTLIKDEEQPHAFMYPQEPMRLSSRPSQSLSQYC